MLKESILKGKAAVITGASRGIGFAIARTLGRMGARLGISARHEGALESAAIELRKEGIEAVPLVADLTKPEEISGLAKKARESLGEVEVLCHAIC